MGVEVALVALHVIAFADDPSHLASLGRRDEEVEAWQLGRLARPQVRQDQAPGLDAGIRRLPDALVERAPHGLARLLQASPGDIVEPAMINAAEAAVFEAAVAEIGAAVGAVQAEQAGPP